MTAHITEVAPDVFRICSYFPQFDLQFSQFLVRDDEPLLYHTGMNAIFPEVKEAVATLIEPTTLRWIGFSHFESDESGSMNRWLELAPHAQVACGMICSAINVSDCVLRPERVLQDGEAFSTGSKRFRYRHTPQLPHAWDAGMLFEETTGSLFCSDILHQNGELPPIDESGEAVERFRATITQYNQSPFANYMPYTEASGALLEQLAALEPKGLLTMHGSVYRGEDAPGMLREIRSVMREVAVSIP